MKRTVQQLAVMGGAPAFAQPLHVGRPNIGDRAALQNRINGALDRRWLTNDGPLVRELEAKLADYLGVAHAMAVCNATVGMEVLARALALSGQVAVPAFTFIATPHAYSWLGLEPLFCDVDAATHTLDANDVAGALTAGVSAIMAVHLWGGICDVPALSTVAQKQGVPLLFDAAHAFASSLHGVRAGGFGNAEVFSFHATKFFNTFEGGLITTNDDDLARELRLMRNFGISGYDAVDTYGTNAKMNEVCAAMGLTSLEAVPQLLALNKSRAEQYGAQLAGLSGLRVVAPAMRGSSNHQYFVIEIGSAAALTRDQLMALLWSENVRARRYFFPGCHRTPPYAGNNQRALPVTDRLVEEVLVLPTGGSVSEEEVAIICDLIRLALSNGDRLAGVLPASLPPGAVQA